eukprot:6142116-Pleurochrysis_carterae.AAC.1
MEGGVELTFSHPSGFHADGTGYVLVCLPWISATEWHAFSVFPHPVRGLQTRTNRVDAARTEREHASLPVKC